jgi:hypothetical protein
MAGCIIFLLLLSACLSSGMAQGPSSPDPVSPPVQARAVSLDNIKNQGIVASGRPGCDEKIPVDVYADPELTDRIGSIASHRFVRYDRLSDITGIPYWAPRGEHALPTGERFKIYGDSITGWIDDEQLLTFSSTWRERQRDKFWAIDGNHTVCLYSRGQYEASLCVALTIWERLNYESIWELRTIKYDPVGLGLYSLPIIDGLIRFGHGDLAIQVSSRGGDAEDGWGSFAFYLYQDSLLVESLVRDYSYRGDRDYTIMECELTLNESKEPVALVIRKHFVIDDYEIPGYHSVLSTADTTTVPLLNQLNK